ncbi:metallophosphoesterase [Microbacterium sp. SS28]|uniref:metallophosphoesterase family protein n=1 Tax=Microbacterium sp. SS28 TaxID=2919948 RepID=UPI001FA9E6FA|nr:metallophosphoesterase [Microbacterium sp. SS28]
MSAPLVTSPPVVMAPRADGFEVVWGVSRLSRGWLEWRAADGASGRFTADPFGLVPQGDSVLRVRAAGLAPGTTLRVRAVTEAVYAPRERNASAWKAVRTLDAASETAHFAVWNDTHERDDTVRALHAATPAVDVLIWNGDLCNDWHDPSAFLSTVLNPAGLDISAGRPLALVMGNHDVRGPWAHRLTDYVATPEGRPFTAFRIGPVACVVLHTGEDKPDDHPTFAGRVAFEPLRAEQAAWLRNVTAQPAFRDAPYRIVFCHIPLRWIDEPPVDYDAGGYDQVSLVSRAAWHEALAVWGAQVIVSGHTHEPVWLAPTADLPYGQLVSGGPETDAAADEAAAWIEGAASPDELVLTMRDLAGAVLHEVRITPADSEGVNLSARPLVSQE